MGKMIYILNNNDLAERMVSAVEKTMCGQSRFNRNAVIFAAVVSIGAMVQSSINRQLKNEICELKYELRKMQQNDGGQKT